MPPRPLIRKTKPAAWLLVWMWFASFCATSAWAVKPLAPIRLTLSVADGAGNQECGPCDLVLRATASMDSDEVQLSFHFPPDMVLLEGTDKWSGPLKQGETQILKVTVKGPSRPQQQVVAKAIMATAFGTFIRQSRLTLDASPSPSPPTLPSVQRRDHVGNILEFKGK